MKEKDLEVLDNGKYVKAKKEKKDNRRKIIRTIIILIIFFLFMLNEKDLVLGTPKKPNVSKIDNNWHTEQVVSVLKSSNKVKSSH